MTPRHQLINNTQTTHPTQTLGGPGRRLSVAYLLLHGVVGGVQGLARCGGGCWCLVVVLEVVVRGGAEGLVFTCPPRRLTVARHAETLMPTPLSVLPALSYLDSLIHI